jgi:hypothetical protein
MGLLKKLKREIWKRRKLCFLIDDDGEIIQEWIGVDMGAYYIMCETAGLQVCYQVQKPLIMLFMKEKGLNAKLSCA